MSTLTDRRSGLSSSIALKAGVRLATTAAITRSGYQTIDGVLPTSADHPDLRRILVKDQSDSAENGIFVMDTGTWARAKDFDSVNDIRTGTMVYVNAGTTHAGLAYRVTSSIDPDTFEIDDDDITFALGNLTSAAIGVSVQAWDAQLDSLSAASADGVSLVTAANYAAMRALLDLESGTDFLPPNLVATTTLIDTDAAYYFADYDCDGVIHFELTQSENQSAISGGGFRDVLFVEHIDGDNVDYTAVGQKVSYAVRGYATSDDVTTAHYKDLQGGTFVAIARTEWTDRGVTGVSGDAIQYGAGIASNEFLASNPALATTQSVSMASVQPILSAKKAANDGSHKYYGVRVTQLGKRVTAAFSAISAGTDGDDGQFQYGLDFDEATIDAAGAWLRAADSESGHVGTIIEYDSSDYSYYDRSNNRFGKVVGGNIISSMGAVAAVFGTNQDAPIATTLATAAVTPRVQALGTTNELSSFMGSRFSADTGGPVYYLSKSRHATVGSHTVVVDGDNLGSISWAGSDGTDFAEGARITAQVDGSPGGGDMPSRLLFYTSGDGSESPTERMRIHSGGSISIGTSTAATISGTGFKEVSFSIGTVTSGTTTPDAANGNKQHYTNGGAHTLAPPAASSTLEIEITNNGSAGAITTSGFTKVGGDSFTTTNGHKFAVCVSKTQTYSYMLVTALQ